MLFCFLTITAFLVSFQQRNLLHADIYNHAVQNLDLMADATFESLLKSDYVTVRTFVERWGESHDDIHALWVVAENGFVIAEYRKPEKKTGETYVLSKAVMIANNPVATIHLVGDYQDAEMLASQLRDRLIFAALIITSLLGAALWLIFRKLALAPLEDMVIERTRALSAANQELQQEIGERKTAQKELREREEHITLILNSISEGIYGIGLDGICTFCNPAALRLLGYGRSEDFIGKPVHQLIHHTRPDGTPYHDMDCRICASCREWTGIHVDDEVFWRSDGTCFSVEYWAHPIIRDNTSIGVVTAFVDITERKHAEEALRDQEEELSLVFRNAPYLMILLDHNRRVVRGNIAAFDHSGKSGAEVVGSLVGEALRCINSLNDPAGCGFGPQCSTCLVRNSILDTMETGLNHYQREANLRIIAEGHYSELTVLVSTARLSIRRQPMVLVSMHDITEKKKLEAQLRQSQKMESIGTLAGGIAHDFNNILSVILGYGEMVLADMAKDDPLRLKLEHMIEAADRAAHLTKDLLLFSRKQALDRKPVDLNKIINKLESFLVSVIGEDISCNTRLHEGELLVFADAHQFEQVMMNLATNARDSMPQGGAFTISTEPVMLDEEFTSAHGLGMPGRYALVSVSDTGHGMSPETKERIFEPFFTTKEVGKGTGLGLSVAYGIIKQHEGYINVYSEPGIGTTFRIYLPVSASWPKGGKEQAAAKTPGRGTETVLLAEDDEKVRNLFLTGLRNFGYTVIEAADGEDAVRKYQEHKDCIELLIFDLIMPKKSGNEAYDEIRKIRPDIKILFVTGYSPDMVRVRASIEDPAAIIYKPFSSMDLLNKVRNILDES